jgi:GNAT superfamily N-acetyltransferase
MPGLTGDMEGNVPDVSIRPATTADLAAIDDIYYRHETRGVAHPPAPRPVAAFRHELAHGEMLVAETEDERVIAFGARIVRDGVAFLSELFVDVPWQSAHIGARLLEAVFPPDVPVRCTLSSTDPRAHARYIRAGMQPRWPNYWLRARTADLRPLPSLDLTAVEADASDGDLVAWDNAICGWQRPHEQAYWLDVGKAQPLWFQRGTQIVGYGYVQRLSASAFWQPEAFLIGPVGARTPADGAACVLAAVQWARPQTEALRLPLPGPHPALAPLLAAGFQIIYVETFCASEGFAVFDPRCYAPSGEFL